MDFIETYKAIQSRKQRSKLRNEIITACYAETSTFYTWFKRKVFPLVAQEKIAQIMDKPVSELFPEYLQPK